MTYTVWWQTGTLYDDYDFEVIDDNPDYACETIISSGSIVELNENGQWNMKFTCKATDSNPHTISIDCGNWLSGAASNVSSFSYTCRYTSSDEWQSFAVSCIVDWEEPTKAYTARARNHGTVSLLWRRSCYNFIFSGTAGKV